MIYSVIDTLIQMTELYADLGYAFDGSYSVLAVISLCTIICSTLFLYAFRSIGTYVMSKKQGLSTPWLSFVPFAGYVQLGKLIGPAKIFGVRFENTGWLMFGVSLAKEIFSGIYDLAFCWKDFLFILAEDKLPVTFATKAGTAFELVLSICDVFASIAYIVIFIFFIVLFLRYYAGKRYALFLVLSILIEPLFGLFVFLCRNNKKRDFAAEMRDYEERMRRRDGYGGRPYSQNNTPSQDDPFSDYAAQDDVFSEYSEKRDGKKKNDDGGNTF